MEFLSLLDIIERTGMWPVKSKAKSTAHREAGVGERVEKAKAAIWNFDRVDVLGRKPYRTYNYDLRQYM